MIRIHHVLAAAAYQDLRAHVVRNQSTYTPLVYLFWPAALLFVALPGAAIVNDKPILQFVASCVSSSLLGVGWLSYCQRHNSYLIAATDASTLMRLVSRYCLLFAALPALYLLALPWAARPLVAAGTVLLSCATVYLVIHSFSALNLHRIRSLMTAKITWWLNPQLTLIVMPFFLLPLASNGLHTATLVGLLSLALRHWLNSVSFFINATEFSIRAFYITIMLAIVTMSATIQPLPFWAYVSIAAGFSALAWLSINATRVITVLLLVASLLVMFG